jgi:hypothetical protein
MFGGEMKCDCCLPSWTPEGGCESYLRPLSNAEPSRAEVPNMGDKKLSRHTVCR